MWRLSASLFLSVLIIVGLCYSLYAEDVTSIVVPGGSSPSWTFQHKEYGSRVGATHVGIDIFGPDSSKGGYPVYSFADGIVAAVCKEERTSTCSPAFGNAVMIKHPGLGNNGADLYSIYLHLEEAPTLVPNRDRVIGGVTQIGKVGKTGVDSRGRSTAGNAYHVHFEIRYFSTWLYSSKWGNIYCPGDCRNHSDIDEFWENPQSLDLTLPEINPKSSQCIARNPELTVSPTVAFQNDSTPFRWSGSGFTCGAKVFIVIEGPDGTKYDEHHADSTGNISWVFAPDCDDTPGTYRITAMDGGPEPIYTDPVTEEIRADSNCQNGRQPPIRTEPTIPSTDFTIECAIDANKNGFLDDNELTTAQRHFDSNSTVSGTNQKIDQAKLIKLYDLHTQSTFFGDKCSNSTSPPTNNPPTKTEPPEASIPTQISKVYEIACATDAMPGGYNDGRLGEVEMGIIGRSHTSQQPIPGTNLVVDSNQIFWGLGDMYIYREYFGDKCGLGGNPPVNIEPPVDPPPPVTRPSPTEYVIRHVMARSVEDNGTRPITTNSFTTSDTRAYSWVELSDAARGKRIRWEFRNPQGKVDNPVNDTARSRYHSAWYRFGDQVGTWTVKFYVDNELQFEDSFTVTTSQVPPEHPSSSGANDLDGDGIYEDVNGDFVFNTNDCEALLDKIGGSFRDLRFDFHRDGVINIADVTACTAILDQASPLPINPPTTSAPIAHLRITDGGPANNIGDHQTLYIELSQHGAVKNLEFSATRSTGQIQQYQWLINGSNVSSNAVMNFSLGEGHHSILLRVIDSQGRMSEVGATVVVSIASQVIQPPIEPPTGGGQYDRILGTWTWTTRCSGDPSCGPSGSTLTVIFYTDSQGKLQVTSSSANEDPQCTERVSAAFENSSSEMAITVFGQCQYGSSYTSVLLGDLSSDGSTIQGRWRTSWSESTGASGDLRGTFTATKLRASSALKDQVVLESVDVRRLGRTSSYIFEIQGQNVSQYRLQIFDSRGQIIHDSGLGTQRALRWDGSLRGHPVANGVYFYLVTGVDSAGNVVRMNIKKIMVMR